MFNVQNMKTPLMIEVGDNDGTVFWHQGIELYNIARRANKNVVLLAYGGEDHGLRRKANQIDYQQPDPAVVRALPERTNRRRRGFRAASSFLDRSRS